MKATLSQVNQFIDRISDSMTDPKRLADAEEELKRYQTGPHNASVQTAIDRARIILWLKEEQAHTAAQVNKLVLGLMQCKQYLVSHPELSASDYSTIRQSLSSLQSQAEPILANDFILMSKSQFLETLQICETALHQRNPNAWKTDLLARSLLTGSIMAFYAYRNGSIGLYQGLLGSLLAMGIEKGMGWIFTRTFRLLTA